MKTINWGILGCNWIADRLAAAIAHCDGCEIAAAAARTEGNIRSFAARHNIPTYYTSLEELCACSDVDVIYISTPHGLHFEHAMQCLEAGKHVLCEKPFTVNTAEAQELFDAAKSKGLFIMEAMWTRFLPSTIKLGELARSGAIGEVRDTHINIAFTINRDNPASRYLAPDLAGGALLDIGVYALTIMDVVMGCVPSEILSRAHIGETGVDMHNSSILTYPDGAMASVTTAFDVNNTGDCIIYGTEGYITFDSCSSPMRIKCHNRADNTTEEFTYTHDCNGYEHEVEAVNRAIREGLLEDGTMPAAKTLEIMKQMDSIREQWGYRYPME